jgi:hypothetical protein
MKPKDSKKVQTDKVTGKISNLLKMTKNLNYRKQLMSIKTIPFSINLVKSELYFDFQ